MDLHRQVIRHVRRTKQKLGKMAGLVIFVLLCITNALTIYPSLQTMGSAGLHYYLFYLNGLRYFAI
jgi:hypothetical protein